MALSSSWFTGKETREEKIALEETIRNSTLILGKIEQMLIKTLAELEVTRKADYDKPSWAYYRADRDGQIRALTTLLDHITAR